MQPVRWGVLSTARIAMKKVIPGLQKSSELLVCGIASRDLAKAEAAAAELGIARAYGSYEEMLADPSIEVIYNPLPNHLHVPMSIAAAKAGKHVLCEKPMALNAAELEALRPFTSQVHIREAFMVRHHPQWIEARERVRSGAIGRPMILQVGFSYFNSDAANIRNQADLGGGAIYDIGCYAVAAGRWFFEAEAQRAVATIDRDPTFGTDRSASGLLDFGDGRQLTFSVATQAVPHQRLVLLGTSGRLDIEIPFNAPLDGPCRHWIDDGSAQNADSRGDAVLTTGDQYQLQGEDFSRAVRNERPDASALDDAIMNMRTIDALFASVQSGAFERP